MWIFLAGNSLVASLKNQLTDLVVTLLDFNATKKFLNVEVGGRVGGWLGVRTNELLFLDVILALSRLEVDDELLEGLGALLELLLHARLAPPHRLHLRLQPSRRQYGAS